MTYVLIGSAIFVAFLVISAVRIVPQSEKHVVERLGRLRVVLGPGLNLIVPLLDSVKHRVSVLERQLPPTRQDAITKDNVLVQVESSVFYRVIEPEKTVYRIADIDGAIATTVTGIVRAEIGKMDLDMVQTNRASLNDTIEAGLANMVDDWGIEVTRVEILDVNLDDATRAAMLQQLNAERARRAQVTEAEGRKRAVELSADADLYAAEKQAQAKRVIAEAEAYATETIATAIGKGGLDAVQYQVALKQVEAMEKVAAGQGSRMILLPTAALDAFKDAFKLFGGPRT
ncbi:MAG: paraslipin [Rhodovulum sulfidophilum]|uniref:Paraslipin n=1 Tax=Rhodovulum sulfidophilum TaxID=35806 RepID=A0A2W5N898_RHOSU|nr:MAG: paraslipin [Rhodovulum sulfidophilum]